MQQWAWNRYQVRLYGIVILHTFGGRLNHNPHLHMMVSAGGLRSSDASWVETLAFNRKEIMTLWRYVICSYLVRALQARLLQGISVPKHFDEEICRQEKRD